MHQKTVLDSGLRVVTASMPHTHSVSLNFFIGTGSRYESNAQAGISHFIEHLCFRGTPRRATPNIISAAIEGIGGVLNGGTDRELTTYWSKVAQSHFPTALDVLTDMLRNSRFDPDDIKKERQIIIEEIHMSKDSPAQQVSLLSDELLWPGHPLGRDIAGSRESVSGITREMILNYIGSQYLPANTIISVAGNIKHEEVVAAVSQAFSDWRIQQTRPGYLPYQEQPNPRLLVEKRDTEQAHLCLSVRGLPLLDPKRFTLDLLNVILGEGMSSRLFTEIRDKLGLAYSIHSYVDHCLDSGALTVYAGVEPSNLPVTIKAILEQFVQLKEVIPEPELSKAKEMAKGRLLLRMEDTRNVASWLGVQEVLTGDILTIDQVVSIIDTITADEVKQLARDLLVGEQLRLAVVGPVSDNESLRELLKL